VTVGRRLAVLTVACTLAAAPLAAAEWVVSAFGAAKFGGDTEELRPGFGAVASFFGEGLVGFEVEAAHAPGFFGSEDAFGSNGLTTAMASLVVSGPLGGVRPYASGGIGFVRSRVDGPGGLFGIDDHDPGMSLGAGLIAMTKGRWGVRGDVRYFRNTGDAETDDPFRVPRGSTDFWRVALGLALRF
jgi:opacity protein-like surface antigen